MIAITRFQDLPITRVSPEAAGAVAITLAVPPAQRQTFAFKPGQFLTVRDTIDGQDVRRSYSTSSPASLLTRQGELTLGIRPVENGVFSNWAAGAGITPILSILASTLEESSQTKFALVYGNRRMASVMFNEALQDLKDRYPGRLTLIHVLSRQAQEVPLLEGRIDSDKVRQIIATLLPVASMDEVFICGPKAMIEATEKALLGAGVRPDRVHAERFTSPTLDALPTAQRKVAVLDHPAVPTDGEVALTVVLDGKPRSLRMNKDERVLDVALNAGLDLPWSYRGGVCCTCRAKVMEGSVQMDKNFTLEPWETDKGFVLSFQARPTSDMLVVSCDEH